MMVFHISFEGRRKGSYPHGFIHVMRDHCTALWFIYVTRDHCTALWLVISESNPHWSVCVGRKSTREYNMQKKHCLLGNCCRVSSHGFFMLEKGDKHDWD